MSRTHDYRGMFDAAGTRTVRRKQVPEVPAEPGLVVEDPATGFCGAVVSITGSEVTLEDRFGGRRVFPLRPAAFLHEGAPATLVRPAPRQAGRTLSASGSVHVANLKARTARAARIWVEGLHDAELLERVWGHDLRVEGVVVEPLHGVDDLAAAVREFDPAPHRRLGILVDHLVDGSKETRQARDAYRATPQAQHNVLVTGHPYVDVWQAVKPSVVGIREWPTIPRGTDWKTGICARLGWGEPADGARRVLGAVRSYRDLEAPMIGAVERLIDFVTAATSGEPDAGGANSAMQ
ncbi:MULTISPECIES: DUF3097 domain-containing protein [Pseudonocardia]|uniref:DUF3097 domain-containing protein n=2 Tax=Pseudonocardia TaxID=1847 RepID=A0A1Y2N3I4_PSEAH|nr:MULTISPECIES: DUF3097 domain-containing protein [Pseudonocardia]OSY41458.1 hypothetical protein BG845_01949 [Pseudonocardia autotrophica]TDN71415.1 hypothetical protein C8E95_0445 [Pseudonocardia autotrophica]BBG02090.1 hypothetical protein Pdca_32990 [Pseudonocardia autotrophica]GEC24104.1 hypothetical protein PSA01_11330 [Pseudonocardia saturnea]